MILPCRPRLKKIPTLLTVLFLVLLFTLNIFSSSNEDDFIVNLPQQLQREDINFFKPLPKALTKLKYFNESAGACSSPPPILLTIVHSAPAHFQHRKAIRKTWGSISPHSSFTTRTVFIIGRSKFPLITRKIHQEAVQYGDLVLPEIPDAYANLTGKHLAGIRWAITNCPSITYVLKADDDALVDMRRVQAVIETVLGSPQAQRTLACRLVPAGSKPRRSGKWQVTNEEFPPGEYPEYCSGLAYFIRLQALKELYESAVYGSTPYLWIDDVFVTGLAAQVAHIDRLDLGVWYAPDETHVLKWLDEENLRPLPWMVAEMSSRHWPQEAEKLWNKTTKAWDDYNKTKR